MTHAARSAIPPFQNGDATEKQGRGKCLSDYGFITGEFIPGSSEEDDQSGIYPEVLEGKRTRRTCPIDSVYVQIVANQDIQPQNLLYINN